MAFYQRYQKLAAERQPLQKAIRDGINHKGQILYVSSSSSAANANNNGNANNNSASNALYVSGIRAVFSRQERRKSCTAIRRIWPSLEKGGKYAKPRLPIRRMGLTGLCQPAMTLDDLVSLKRLNDAFYACAEVSRWKESTQRYRMNLLLNNLTLRNEVLRGAYRVSKTIDFIIRERGKAREIHAPPIRDRVLQKAVVRHILLPYLTKSLVYDNYASLKNRGTSFARKRFDIHLQRFIAKHGREGYILQIDIRKYFDSIDHSILKGLIRESIKEPPEIMSLIDYLIDTSSETGRGLNLGAEAPQIFAIYYLSRFDSWLKVVKGVKHYGRYMDDMFILSESKAELKELLAGIRVKLDELKLAVNERKTHIVKLRHGFTFLQIKYSVTESGKIIKRPSRAKIVRERRRLKRFRRLCDTGRMKEYDVLNCYKSWRETLRKDCNACHKTIENMDNLCRNLFPNVPKPKRRTRDKAISEIFKEADYEDLRYQRQ